MLVVVNIGEDQLDEVDDLVAPVRDGVDALGVCLELEAEAAQLDPEARVELLDGLGLGESVVPASRAPRTTCSVGARSSPPATRNRARGRSAPAPRRPSARA